MREQSKQKRHNFSRAIVIVVVLLLLISITVAMFFYIKRDSSLPRIDHRHVPSSIQIDIYAYSKGKKEPHILVVKQPDGTYRLLGSNKEIIIDPEKDYVFSIASFNRQ